VAIRTLVAWDEGNVLALFDRRPSQTLQAQRPCRPGFFRYEGMAIAKGHKRLVDEQKATKCGKEHVVIPDTKSLWRQRLWHAMGRFWAEGCWADMAMTLLSLACGGRGNARSYTKRNRFGPWTTRPVRSPHLERHWMTRDGRLNRELRWHSQCSTPT